MQQDTPVRADESDEVRALRQLARVAGWCVTSTTGGGHAPRSLHYAAATNGKGRAVDLADRRGPSSNSEWLLAINEEVIRLVPLPLISELIYGGDRAICVKNGRRVNGNAVYGPTTMRAHLNHVHFAVVPGFDYTTTEEPAMPNDPTIPDIRGPVEFHPIVSADGQCTGYYIFSPMTGEIHAWGDGARFYGRSEVVT